MRASVFRYNGVLTRPDVLRAGTPGLVITRVGCSVRPWSHRPGGKQDGTAMSSQVDLYGAAYRGLASALYADIRREAFGEDIGQTGWLTAEEQDLFISWLGLSHQAICSTWHAVRVDQPYGSPRRPDAELLGSICMKMASRVHKQAQRNRDMRGARISVRGMPLKGSRLRDPASTQLSASTRSITCQIGRAFLPSGAAS